MAQSSRVLDEIKDIYTKKIDVDKAQRAGRPAHAISLLTNCVKACLIHAYCPLGSANVLDIGCGRGWDAQKYAALDVKAYTGTDMSSHMIEEGLARLKNSWRGSRDPSVTLLNLQHSQILGDQKVLDACPFQAVSSFFSLQSSFISRESARSCLRDIAEVMECGAHFLCIIPDGDLIRSEIISSADQPSDRTFQFRQEHTSEEGYIDSLYGYRYLFSLDGSFHDLPELAIPWSELHKLLRKFVAKSKSIQPNKDREIVIPANQRNILANLWRKEVDTLF